MNTTEEYVNKLTRDLMKDTAEQPPFSLNARIMALIMGEKRAAIHKCYMKKLPSFSTILIVFIVYMAIIAGGVMLCMKEYAATDSMIRTVKHFFPLLLTISSSVSIFFFFTQLDNWLRIKESMKENLHNK
ncbi:hypothetical protein [Parabacteroides chinchillae]|uniref:Uncharacterized protein n=1 Tax=Parabacteroides chinchillae TaxID=871327 RepID=A0A8G2BWJ8_9BACT|nr:hypothetical protein [Parabacteroides chinchillae]SEF89694.1 hypothetical protein SAMN05444001_10930 [Parabacteroides chinchillae]